MLNYKKKNKPTPCILDKPPIQFLIKDYTKEEDLYICNYTKPIVTHDLESKVTYIFNALSLRNGNNNLDLAACITYFQLYFNKTNVELLLDITRNVDMKISKEKQHSE